MIPELVIYLFLIIGIFFTLLGSLGLIRFPDVYTRLHAGTKCTTFGAIFLCLSVIIHGLHAWFWLGNTDGSVFVFHTGAALVAILLTNPTGAHAIARAAHRSGVLPFGAVVDDLQKKTPVKTTKKQTKKKPAKKKTVKKEVAQ